jgi:Xaa-Pro aminopeptidase
VAYAALLGLLPALVGLPARAGADSPVAPLISVAPPAPVVSDDERRAELAARRARVAERIGPKSLLLLFSGEARVYAGDTDYEFRQENNLYYLTQLRQQGAMLALLPGNAATPEILFLPQRDPRAETWTGHMYSPEEARAVSGINEIWDARVFEAFVQGLRERRAYRPKPDAIFLSASGANVNATPNAGASGFEGLFKAMEQGEAALYLLDTGGRGVNAEFRREHDFAVEWAKPGSGFVVKSAWPVFTELRMRKSPLELRWLQHAVDISIEAHERAQVAAARAAWEYEIEAEVDYTFKRRNADNWGYPNIVACGASATTLHYETSQARCAPGQLVLMDVGAEYEHLSADVTRTFPVNGRFSPAQADIYNAVLAAQERALAVIKPGATLGQVHAAAVESFKDNLLRLGLITDRNSNQHAIWFMHGTSHFIGLSVHDVGRPGVLEPNMTFTVEPGLYVREDTLERLPDTPEFRKFKDAVRPAFEKYKGIGVRIEDDVVVTADGYRNMSAALPRTIADIEAFHARAARELRHEPPH